MKCHSTFYVFFLDRKELHCRVQFVELGFFSWVNSECINYPNAYFISSISHRWAYWFQMVNSPNILKLISGWIVWIIPPPFIPRPTSQRYVRISSLLIDFMTCYLTRSAQFVYSESRTLSSRSLTSSDESFAVVSFFWVMDRRSCTQHITRRPN